MNRTTPAFCDYYSTIEGEPALSRSKNRTTVHLHIYQPYIIEKPYTEPVPSQCLVLLILCCYSRFPWFLTFCLWMFFAVVLHCWLLHSLEVAFNPSLAEDSLIDQELVCLFLSRFAPFYYKRPWLYSSWWCFLAMSYMFWYVLFHVPFTLWGCQLSQSFKTSAIEGKDFPRSWMKTRNGGNSFLLWGTFLFAEHLLVRLYSFFGYNFPKEWYLYAPKMAFISCSF